MPRDGETRDEWKARMGISRRQNKHHVHRGTTKTWGVKADDGPLRGMTVGTQTEHWSDRLDAKAHASTIVVNPAALRARRIGP